MSRSTTRVLGVLCLTICALLVVTSIPASAVGDRSGELVREVGRLPVDSPEERRFSGGDGKDLRSWNVHDVDLVLDPPRRRAYLMFATNIERVQGPPPAEVHRTVIQAFDLDSLERLGETIILHRPQLDETESPYKGQWLRALDPKTGLLYMGSVTRKVVEDSLGVSHFPGDITVLDGRNIERGLDPVVARLRPPPDFEGRLAARLLVGISVFHDRGGRTKLLLMYSPPSAGASPIPVPMLAQMDASSGAIDWSLDLDGCARGYFIQMKRSWIPIIRSTDGRRVYSICQTQRQLASVVRVDLDPGGSPAAGSAPSLFPGPSFVSDAFGDATSERLLMATTSAGGRALWVFDGTVSRYVGAVGLTQAIDDVAYGIDERQGRLYVLTPDHVATATGGDVDEAGRLIPVQGGLLSIDFRLTPPPQAVLHVADVTYPGQPTLAVDSFREGNPVRILLRRAAGAEPTPEGPRDEHVDQMRVYPSGRTTNFLDESFYRVIEDAQPIPDPLTLADADRFTVDVPELGGLTDSTYDASGSGYGIRVQLVGGIGALLRVSPDWESTLRSQGNLSPCWIRDRDVVMGWVRETHLTDLQTEAQASGFDLDQTSRADLDQTFSRCPPPNAPKELPSETLDDTSDALWALLGGRPWESESVECAGDDQGAGPGARVRCRFGDGSAEGEASWAGVSVPGVSVGYGWSRTTVEREPKRGVVVKSEALARAIQIEDVTIDVVRSTAESWSNGRPSDGRRTSLTRQLCGVVTPAYTQDGCLAPQQAIDAMNNALRGRLEVQVPTPDELYAKGSTGGYVAGITKNAADTEEDKLINHDFHREVPGLRILGYRDTAEFGPGRQIVELAGVRAITTYGIQCLTPRVYSAKGKACVMPSVPGSGIVPPTPQPQASPPVVPPKADQAIDPIVPPVVIPPGPARVVQEFLVRSLTEGLLSGGIWFLLGLPFVLAARRGRVAKVRSS